MVPSVLQTKRRFAIALSCILLFAAVVRMYRLSVPSGYYFDEVYHAVTSKLVSRNDPRAFEWWNDPPEKDTAVDWLHPALAKYTQGAAMLMFGENSFGWRISSALFGVLVIAATALLAQSAFRNRSITLIAALLASLDGLLLAQSRIAMNDIHVTFMLLLTSVAYLRYRRYIQETKISPRQNTIALLGIGLLVGLCMGTKWSGLFILGPIGLFELYYLARTRWTSSAEWIRASLLRFVLLIVLPFFVYIASYAQMYTQGKSLFCQGTQIVQGQCYCSQESSTWVKLLGMVFPSNQAAFEALEARGGCKRLISHFSELQNQIWWYQTNLKATHPFQSRPWQWALDLRPVWTSVTYGLQDGKIAHVYTAGNPVLFWGGLASVIYLGGSVLIRAKHGKPVSHELVFILLLYCFVWVPWTLSPRIMFFYHYTPAVPMLAILTAYTLHMLPFSGKTQSRLMIGFLGLAVLAFIGLFPLVTGYPMQQGYFDLIFKIFPSWK